MTRPSCFDDEMGVLGRRRRALPRGQLRRGRANPATAIGLPARRDRKKPRRVGVRRAADGGGVAPELALRRWRVPQLRMKAARLRPCRRASISPRLLSLTTLAEDGPSPGRTSRRHSKLATKERMGRPLQTQETLRARHPLVSLTLLSDKLAMQLQLRRRSSRRLSCADDDASWTRLDT